MMMKYSTQANVVQVSLINSQCMQLQKNTIVKESHLGRL